MGGADTEISDTTTTVALEMAWFDPVVVARTATRLGLRSEASIRFERGRDPYGIDRAVARFVDLLRETCPGLVVHAGAVDARGELPPEERSVRVRPDRVRTLLGADIETHVMVERLAPIGFTTTLDQGGVMDVSLPSWRPDCQLEVDVIEEIARHVGYERLGRTVPKSVVPGRLSPVQSRRRVVREVLYGLGISEAMPNPFLAPGDLERAGLDSRGLAIANPLVAEESILRSSLRPGLLKAVAYNASHRADDVSLFEIGHVYRPADGVLPDEREQLAVVLAGRDGPAAVPVLVELLAALGRADALDIDQSEDGLAGLHPGRSGTVRLEGPMLSARSARSIPACSRPTTSRDGSPGWSSTCRCSWPWIPRSRNGGRSAGSPPATSTSPSWLRTTSRPPRSAAPSPVARRSCWPISSCSTCTAVRASTPASGAWPSAFASRLPTTP